MRCERLPPKCGFDGKGAAKGRRAGQHETRDVRAGDEQHDADHREQQDDSATSRAEDAVEERRDGNGRPARHGMFRFRQAARDDVQLRSRLLSRYSGCKPAEDGQQAEGARFEGIEPPSRIHRGEGRHDGCPCVRPCGVGKVRRHDPDDGERLIANHDLCPHHVDISPEVLAPEAIAEEQHACGSSDVIGRHERTPQSRAGSQQIEERSRYEGSLEPNEVSGAIDHEIPGGRANGGHRLERTALCAPVDEIPVGDLLNGLSAPGGRFRHYDDAIWLADQQWAQQHRADGAEDDDVGGDGHRQGCDDGTREHRRVAQPAHPESKILRECHVDGLPNFTEVTPASAPV